MSKKFDVVIGNPPYQENSKSESTQSSPIYNKFVEASKAINPSYICMITPSRWFSGGIGLNNFRKDMLSDKRIVKLVDYTNAKDIFPTTSIGGGVSFFVWDRSHNGLCEYVSNHNNIEDTMCRNLDTYDTFIRYNLGYSIVKKVTDITKDMMSSEASPLSPFGLMSSERGVPSYVDGFYKLNSSSGESYISPNNVPKGEEYIDRYNLMVSKVTSEHAGEPDKDGRYKVLARTKVMGPKEVCTFSYLIIGNFSNEECVYNLDKYSKSKMFRFLLLQSITSINISRNSFKFVPLQDFTEDSDIDWSKSIPEIDQQLYEKYNLNEEEIAFIEDNVKEME